MNSSVSDATGPGDTTLFLATAASYTSDGPTLPIIGGAGEHTAFIAAPTTTRSNDNPRPAKKQKTNSGAAKEPPSVQEKERLDIAPLYQPWTLLPPEVLLQVEKRLGKVGWKENCTPVVFTKNQNVKSGINRLKVLLGFEGDDGALQGARDKSKPGGPLIAVSAHGVGTMKMVGIVEMTKRVVKGEEEGEREMWCLYTSLRGIGLRKMKEVENTREDQGKDMAGEEDEDFDISRKEQGTNERDDKGARTPVLTTWFSRNSIPELKAAFGEQVFYVGRKSSEG